VRSQLHPITPKPSPEPSPLAPDPPARLAGAVVASPRSPANGSGIWSYTEAILDAPDLDEGVKASYLDELNARRKPKKDGAAESPADETA
jgi:hypothetical protein